MNQERQTVGRYDAIIVGARCAGAATALLLARRGARVLLLDRAARGSDTLSTHALMRGGVQQLERWGLGSSLRSMGAPPIRTTTFHYGETSHRIDIRPRNGVDALYAPRRYVLDSLLVDAAEDAGATVKHGVELDGLHQNALGGVNGVKLRHRDGTTMSAFAKIVIGADGLRSKVARLVKAPTYGSGENATASIYGYFKGLSVDGSAWHFGKRAAAGMIPTHDEQVCVFATLPADVFLRTVRGDMSRTFYSALEQCAPEIGRHIEARGPGFLVEKFRGFAGQVGFLRQSVGDGWALVGDAGYFKDPITAHGITDALIDAEGLADAVTAGTPDALLEYQDRRDHRAAPMLTISDRIASFDWSFDELGLLHRALSQAMNDETDAIAQLDPFANGPRLNIRRSA